MSLLEVIKALIHGKTHWTGTHKGSRLDPVTGSVRVEGNEKVHFDFTFTEGGAEHTFKGERALQGGASTLQLDGAAVTGGHIALRAHSRLFPPSTSLEVDFDFNNDTYRFDGAKGL